MLEEYLKTLEILKNHKVNLIKQTMLPEIEPNHLNELINQLCNIDAKISEYNHLIENENHINDYKPKNKNNKNNLYKKSLNSKSLNNQIYNEKNEQESDISSESDNNNGNVNHKLKISKTYKVDLEASIVEEIIKLKGKIPINIKQSNNNIETTYTYKNENKKF